LIIDQITQYKTMLPTIANSHHFSNASYFFNIDK